MNPQLALLPTKPERVALLPIHACGCGKTATVGVLAGEVYVPCCEKCAGKR